MTVASLSDGRMVDYDQGSNRFLVDGQQVDWAWLSSAESTGALTWIDEATRTWAHQNFASQAQPTPAAAQPAGPAAAATAGAPEPRKKFPVWAIILIVVVVLFALCACGSLFGAARVFQDYGDIITAPQAPEDPTDPTPYEDEQPYEDSQTEPGAEAPAGTDAGIATLEKYEQIENGMSFDEVTQIMGSEGEQLSSVEVAGESVAIYIWYADDGVTNVTVTLQNDKVIVKAQYGLE